MGFDTQQTILLAIVAAIAFAAPPVAGFLKRKLTTGKATADKSAVWVADYQALQTLTERAERLKCPKLRAALVEVKNCFLNGENPKPETETVET